MNRTRTVFRADVVRLARAWIGTPYHHQASERLVGTDCIGLVRGVWREIYGREPEPLPGYSRDWAEATGRETLLAAARRHFVPIELEAARAGDVLVFRYRARAIAKHTGILTSDAAFDPARRPAARCEARGASPTLIHACEGAPVSEIALGPWWQRRIVAAFSFPGIID